MKLSVLNTTGLSLKLSPVDKISLQGCARDRVCLSLAVISVELSPNGRHVSIGSLVDLTHSCSGFTYLYPVCLKLHYVDRLTMSSDYLHLIVILFNN